MIWRLLGVGLLILSALVAIELLEDLTQINSRDLFLLAAGIYMGVLAWRKIRQEGFTRTAEVLLYLSAIGIVIGIAFIFNFHDQPIWIASMGLLVIGFALRVWRM